MPAFAPEDALPLDPSFYRLSAEEASFYKKATNITSDEELKDHILRIQQKSYNVHPYPCIRLFDFITLKISLHPVYPAFLELGKRGGIFLDIGCCFGNDIQKAVLDGYPKENVVASDLCQEFWDLGYQLFRTDESKFPVPFICGDIFDDSVLDLNHVEGALQTPLTDTPDLLSLKSLTPLRNRVTAIHAAALFHLFNEATQTLLAHRVASLLSPEKGSILFGSHIGRATKGFRTEAAGFGALADRMFCHDDKSWAEVWEGVFPKGSVKIDVKLEEITHPGVTPQPGIHYYQLVWCITRL